MNDYLRSLSAGSLCFIVGAMLGFSVRPNEIKLTVEVTPPVFAVAPEKPQAAPAEQIFARLTGITNGPTNLILTGFVSYSNSMRTVSNDVAMWRKYVQMTSTNNIETRPTFEEWRMLNDPIRKHTVISNYINGAGSLP